MEFDARDVSPMLIGKEQLPFEDDEFIYECKFDGIRCLVYIEENKTDLRNKRNLSLNKNFPELISIHKQGKVKCILDGEVYIFNNGKTDFFHIQKRALLQDPFKISLHSKSYPAYFTAFDILYYREHFVTDLSLMKRKELLQKAIKEQGNLSISRYTDFGLELFEKTKALGLEGIVAKRKDSLYHCGKRTKDWIKCKHLLDEDFIICGYIPKENGIYSLILAQYSANDIPVYKGHVTLGVSINYLLENTKQSNTSLFSNIPKGNEDAIWITPPLVGCVKFMEYTENGHLRQPVFKGFREDKSITECRIKENK